MKKAQICIVIVVLMFGMNGNIVSGETFFGHPKVTQYTKAITDMVAFEAYQEFIGFMVALDDPKAFEDTIHNAYYSMNGVQQNRLQPEILMLDICFRIGEDIRGEKGDLDKFMSDSVDPVEFAKLIQGDYPNAYSLLVNCSSSDLTEGLEELEILMAIFVLNIDMGSDILMVDENLENLTVDMDIINMLIEAMISFDSDAASFANNLDLLNDIADYYNEASLHDRELMYFGLLDNGFINDVDYQVVDVYSEIADLSACTWAEEAIYELAASKVLLGKEIDYMKPKEEITRAEIAVMVARLLDLKTEKKSYFKDVTSSDWYYEDLCAVVDMGIITGKPGDLFDPNGQLTRSEFATIIGRVLELEASHGSVESQSSILRQFYDYKELPSWAESYIATIAKHGIIKGIPVDSILYYKPYDETSRAEAAVILYRMSSIVDTVVR